jgi:cobalt/nickel transport system permease protein
MHIPDGFLDAKTSLATTLLACGSLAVALRHARMTLSPRKVPLLGLSAAFVFAAQMVNFPVAAGTSGHFIGGTLAAVLLGPSAAVIVLATVLLVQCFAFADGGITALGANIFNMGVIGGVGGWMAYAALSRIRGDLKGRIVAAVVAAWLSTVMAAVVCAGELATSGTAAWNLAFPAMGGVHMLIGVGEGLITALVLAAVAQTRPDLLSGLNPSVTPTPEKQSLKPLLAYGFMAALGIGIFVSPFACPWENGLDRVASTLGFKHKEQPPQQAPLAEYKVPGISRGGIATALAGGLGTATVFGLGLWVARTLVPRATPTETGR